MNIKNLKTISVGSTIGSTNTFNAYINIPFNAQFMKVKSIAFTLNSSTEVGFAGNITRFFYNVKSSLVNYEILTLFALSSFINDPVISEPIVGSYSSHLNIVFKLNNQIINGTYSFDIATGDGQPPFDTGNYVVDINLQLEFIEYK